MSDRLRAEAFLVSNFDVKLVRHVAALNLHVLVLCPSWVSSAIKTDTRSPFLKLSDTHENEGGHSFERHSSMMSQVGLNGVDLQMTVVPVDHCSSAHATDGHTHRLAGNGHAHRVLVVAHVLLRVSLVHTHVLLGISLVHLHARVAHASHVLLLHRRLSDVRHGSDSHCFGMIGGLDNKSSCGHASPEKLDRFVEMAIWTFEEVKGNLGMSDSFRAEDVFVSDFNVKLVLHATAFNLHVFVESPSWVSAAINTDRRSPFLKLADTHINKGVHSIHNSSSVVSQMTLYGVDSQMTTAPVNHCSLHRLLHSHARVTHSTHVLLLWVSLVHAHVLLRISLIHAHVLLLHSHAGVDHATHVLLHHRVLVVAHVLLRVSLVHTHVLLGISLVHLHARVAHASHVLLLHRRLSDVRHSSDSHCFGMIGGLDNKSSCGHASPEKLDRLVEMAIWTFEEV